MGLASTPHTCLINNMYMYMYMYTLYTCTCILKAVYLPSSAIDRTKVVPAKVVIDRNPKLLVLVKHQHKHSN
jgi:hypothetical protein